MPTLFCLKCGFEFLESDPSTEHHNKGFIWHGAVLCKDCLAISGINPKLVTTFSVYQPKEHSGII